MAAAPARLPEIVVTVPADCVEAAAQVLPATGADDSTTTTVVLGGALVAAGAIVRRAARWRPTR